MTDSSLTDDINKIKKFTHFLKQIVSDADNHNYDVHSITEISHLIESCSSFEHSNYNINSEHKTLLDDHDHKHELSEEDSNELKKLLKFLKHIVTQDLTSNIMKYIHLIVKNLNITVPHKDYSHARIILILFQKLRNFYVSRNIHMLMKTSNILDKIYFEEFEDYKRYLQYKSHNISPHEDNSEEDDYKKHLLENTLPLKNTII